MGPDGERLGLPCKKFEFYLMREEALVSLKVLRKEGEREGEEEEETDRQTETEGDGISLALDPELRKTDLLAVWRIY